MRFEQWVFMLVVVVPVVGLLGMLAWFSYAARGLEDRCMPVATCAGFLTGCAQHDSVTTCAHRADRLGLVPEGER